MSNGGGFNTIKIVGPGTPSTIDVSFNAPIEGQFFGFLNGLHGWFLVPYSSIAGAPSLGSLLTSGSIIGGGSLTSELMISLSGDLSSPGVSMLYGTDASGVRGWYAQASGTGGGGSSSTGFDSITGTTTIALVNDVATPNNGQFYGFISGTRGWFVVPYSAISGTPSIPTVGTLTTSGSVTGGGSMTGNLTVQLSGDNASPGNTMLYGTNGSGTKGWYAQPSGGSGSTGADSVTGTTTMTLVNDVVTPSNGQFYGYTSGARGWVAVPYSTLTGAPSIPTVGTLTTSDSITGGGSMTGNLTVTLVNDSATPGNNQVYGTSAIGVLGYRAISSLPVAYASVTGTPTAPVALTSTVGGLTPTVTPNSAAQVLLGSGVWGTLAYSALSGSPTLGTSAAKDIPSSGNASSTQVVYGSDTRLSDSRTPTAHSTTHKSGGTDSIALDTLAVPTDITTLNASSAAHGLLVKVSGTATDFVGGDNACHAPSTIALDTLGACTDITTRNASSSQHGLLVKVSGTATDFVGGDNACHAHSTVPLDTLGTPTDVTTLNASTSAHGLLKKLDNNVVHYMDGTGNWSSPPPSKPWRVWIASEGFPNATAYPAWATINTTPYLSYAASVVSTQCFMHRVPAGAILTSGVLIRLTWASATATTGNVVWGVAIENFGVATVISDHFDTQTTSTAAVGGVVSITVETDITETNNTLSVGQLFRLQVQRVGTSGSDTMVGAAELFSVSIEGVA